MRKLLIMIVILPMTLFMSSAWAGYTFNSDGTVTDSTTGLIWMRCVMGESWAENWCWGKANTYTWDQAKALNMSFGGESDWRLPSIRELETLVDRTHYNPAMADIFPFTPVANYWSASAYAIDSGSAWNVNFYYGNVYAMSKSETYYVRLVRSGKSFGSLDVARPTPDYINNGDGTVTHTPTALMWKRCPEGQAWSGSTCSGSVSIFNVSIFTWAVATRLTSTFAGKSDWRLPTDDELLSLVDYTVTTSPTINSTMFPNTPASSFWSASRTADGNASPVAWHVGFGEGGMYRNSALSLKSARLVRGGDFSLGVSSTGNGWVSSSPTGIACGSMCIASFSRNASITLTATSSAGSSFTGWSGACTNTSGTCTVNMTAAKSVTATFTSMPQTSSSDCMFNWAERTYPQFFSPAGSTSAVSAPYYYRYYSGTGNYLATSSTDNHIWVLGPSWGTIPLDVAPVATFLTTAGCSP